uniref:MP n=1 Tax=Iris germanica capillovirus 1 TaxID=2794426 RepID=A0A7T5QZA9_9VIRU|nr:MP [Iris germanica capillovirus 1]
MSIINVNRFLSRVESRDLKIDAIRSNELYKDATIFNPAVLNCIRRFETNIKVVAESGDDLYLSDFQLLDREELDFIKRASSKFKYIHVGAILVAVRAMFPNSNGKSGKVVIYDGSCIDDDKSQGFIAAEKFSFNEDTCYFVVKPRHILSTTDVHLGTCLRFQVSIDCPRYAVDRELVALDIGMAYRLCNSSRFLDTKQGASGWVTQSILGCEALDFTEEIGRSMSRNGRGLQIESGPSTSHFDKRLFGPAKIRRSRAAFAKKGKEDVEKAPAVKLLGSEGFDNAKQGKLEDNSSLSEEKERFCTWSNRKHFGPRGRAEGSSGSESPTSSLSTKPGRASFSTAPAATTGQAPRFSVDSISCQTFRNNEFERGTA